MNKNCTSVKMRLSFFNDYFDLKQFSNILEVDSTKQYFKDEIFESYGVERVRKNTAWHYSTDYVVTRDSNEVFNIIYRNFNAKIDKIQKLVIDYKLNVKLEIVIEIYDDHCPAVYFDKKMMSFLNALNAVVDIDMYSDRND